MPHLFDEKIIRLQICVSCQKEFPVTDKDEEFFELWGIPVPSNCPQCREQERLTFRNDRYYYSDTCTLCKKKIISIYDPAHTRNVYCHDCWWSDQWDAKQYGKDFDFSRPFFDQYAELLHEVPKLAMMNDNGAGSENCEYTYDISRGKNSYLVIASWYFQNCMYGFQNNQDKDCIDNYFVNESTLMYNSVMCENCYDCQECMQCHDSSGCIFGYDLKNCKDCLLSAGLRNKQYYIFNQPYPKEEFLKMKESLTLHTWKGREEQREKFEEFLKKIPRKYANLVNCENCTGDNLVNSKDSKNCFNQKNIHSCKFMWGGDGAKDSYDCLNTGRPELCYNGIAPDESYNVINSIYCWKTKNSAYSENCHSYEDIFGCIGMRRGRHCVLNRQCTKEEYETMKQKIIGHMEKNNEWGKFFPLQATLFAYNETPAQEWYPLSREIALKKGYRWKDELPGSYKKETIRWDEIPSDIRMVGNDIARHIFPCVQCEKNFKIQEKELAFYKKNDIPLPRLCIDCRYRKRIGRLNPRILLKRKCDECGIMLESPYTENRPEKIYCENCYLKNVY